MIWTDIRSFPTGRNPNKVSEVEPGQKTSNNSLRKPWPYITVWRVLGPSLSGTFLTLEHTYRPKKGNMLNLTLHLD